jgi:hypothetical protein
MLQNSHKAAKKAFLTTFARIVKDRDRGVEVSKILIEVSRVHNTTLDHNMILNLSVIVFSQPCLQTVLKVVSRD